ncbi:hypothetical protein [Streptomyces hesseae]|uniref:Lipoprotein n=1 Tax=Streptomyces hesseae TaxID=3075519 RepID=A0ABU2STT1_9ACTN|nr:hypothetical protein [Streptomyces sp. DSM 40473]MDT0451415.1 hypothetical protein [Streptomyces sp. DSM 40473]
MKRMTAAAVVVASALLVTGCSSSSDGGKDGGDGKDGKKPGSSGASKAPGAFGQDEAAMKAVAVKYRQSVHQRDWRQACELSTQQGRDGKSVDDCAKANIAGDGDASPATVVFEGTPETVPATDRYLAGTGLMVTTTFTNSEGRHAERVALRMVKEGATWLVEQDADIYDSEMRHADPVRDALMRSK